MGRSTQWHPFLQLILARLREFSREPHALFWVYGFPIILAIGLGSAFSGNQATPPIVDIQEEPNSLAAAELAARLNETKKVKAAVFSKKECEERFEHGTSALFLVQQASGKILYRFDETRPESREGRYLVEALVRRPAPRDFDETPGAEVGSRYIDFLMPGLIGMNIMGGGLFGVGFVLVDMRVRKLFKRLMATPMRHSDFLLSLLTSRLLFLMPEMFSLLFIGWLVYGVPIRGSFFTLLLVIVVGASAFAGLGLLLSCRTDKSETMSGFINVVMLPQYLLSGIFFSSTHFPDEVQPFIQALPLTQLNNALRAVMLEGKGLHQVAVPLGILAAWAIVTFLLALRWFKWR